MASRSSAAHCTACARVSNRRLVKQFLVQEELRLDSVGAVVAELADKSIMRAEKLEQLLPGLRLPLRRWRAVRGVEGVVAHAG
jgi:hypothetical protein